MNLSVNDAKTQTGRQTALLSLAADFCWETHDDVRFERVSSNTSLCSRDLVAFLKGRALAKVFEEWGDASLQEKLSQKIDFRDAILRLPTRAAGARYLLLSGLAVYGDDGRFHGYQGLGRVLNEAPFNAIQRREMNALSQRADLAKERETRLRSESEALLSSLSTLVQAQTTREKCAMILDQFAPILGFEDALILRYDVKTQLKVIAARDEVFLGRVVERTASIDALMEDDASIIATIMDHAGLQAALPAELSNYSSILTSSLQINKDRALLLAFHSQANRFKDYDLKLMRRLSVLATDALQLEDQKVAAANAEKLASLGEIMASIAHEINQPLSVVSLATSNIRHQLDKGVDVEKIATRLGRIDEQVAKVGEIVETVRNFAYPEKSRSVREVVDLAHVMHSVDILISGNLRKKQIGCEVAFSEESMAVHGNALALQQVMINLLNNARDALVERREKAGVDFQPHIHIDVHKPADQVGFICIDVQDNAGGVPDHLIPQLFESFFTMKERGKGTGLGLPICKTLIEEMGGAISFQNKGEGACVSMRLPVVNTME